VVTEGPLTVKALLGVAVDAEVRLVPLALGGAEAALALPDVPAVVHRFSVPKQDSVAVEVRAAVLVFAAGRRGVALAGER
jgi:hypothetical protein